MNRYCGKIWSVFTIIGITIDEFIKVIQQRNIVLFLILRIPSEPIAAS